MNIIGINVSLPDICRCASDIAIVRAGDAAHHLSLKCRSCERHRGWLSKPTADWISSLVTRFGVPEVITIHSSRPSRAAAKQDTYLQGKYGSAGKSWFDIISETFDEIAPAPRGTGQDNDASISAKNTSQMKG
jgi:hypothetical protein